jgi:hypothetical protein
MKTLLLLLALLSLSISRSEGGETTIDVKLVSKVAKSQDDATKWKLDELPHKEWLSEISVKDWTLLHESETKDWHFAVFRDGDRLIFWKGNKTGINTETQFSVHAPQERRENEPDTAVITHQFSFPGGSATYYAFGSITPIRGGFKGKIRIEFSMKVGGSFVPAFDETVEWK